jgi:hypothetical protein
MKHTFSFGDLVVVGGAQGSPGVAIVAEIRSADCRAHYLRPARSLWVPLRDLRPAGAAELEGSVEKLISDLLALLGATEMEVALLDAGRCRLAASHGAITPAVVDRVRGLLGERLLGYGIRPQGMRRIESVLEFLA